jgi:hypothetical protein
MERIHPAGRSVALLNPYFVAAGSEGDINHNTCAPGTVTGLPPSGRTRA